MKIRQMVSFTKNAARIPDVNTSSDEQLKARSRKRGHMHGNPIEKAGHLKMGDEDHHAQQEDQRVPVDGLVGLGERDDACEHHRDGAAKCRSGAVKMAAAARFRPR